MPIDRAPLIAFGSCAVLAGGNAVCVRLSNRELEPLWGAALRFLAAAVVLWGLVALTGRPVPRAAALRGAVVYGMLNFAAAFALAYHGLVRSPAGTGGILLALVPLLTLVLATVHRQEQLTRGGIAGAAIAVGGVSIIGADSVSADIPLSSILALVGSAACFAEATVIARRFPQADPLAANAVGMTAAALALVIGSMVAGETITVPRRATTWYSLAYLVPVGSVAVFALFLFVVRHWPASRAAYVDVLIPISTAIAAALILAEPIGSKLALGGALILAGTLIGALPRTAEPGLTTLPAHSQ